MTGVNVKSEIGPLKKVILHRPGKELLNLTPDTLERADFALNVDSGHIRPPFA